MAPEYEAGALTNRSLRSVTHLIHLLISAKRGTPLKSTNASMDTIRNPLIDVTTNSRKLEMFSEFCQRVFILEKGIKTAFERIFRFITQNYLLKICYHKCTEHHTRYWKSFGPHVLYLIYGIQLSLQMSIFI
jgi:hypothetical protein